MPASLVEIAPAVARLPVAIVNVYFVGAPGSPWILVDTGLPGFAWQVRAAAEARYGAGARPEAIVLTHGHFDHVGNAHALASAWNVPVYAHPLETPYLSGQSNYPPLDPTVGGFVPFLSRTFPSSGTDQRPRLHDLPGSGAVPGADGWEWHWTPGHAPGHVSLFRAADRTLLAGDALATVDMASFRAMVTQAQQLCLPPTFATCDWPAAQRSVDVLVALQPRIIGAGHGRPMEDGSLAEQLQVFADGFAPPAHGRYVPVAARTDIGGIVSVPPPAPDPVGVGLAVGAAVVGAGLLWRWRSRRDG